MLLATISVNGKQMVRKDVYFYKQVAQHTTEIKASL